MRLWPFKRPALDVQQRLDRGDRVRRLQESGDFTAASEEVVRAMFKRWTEARTVDEREAIHAEFRAWGTLTLVLDQWKADATITRDQINRAGNAE